MVPYVNPSLVLRADGDERIGAGHVMRCLSLAEAWRDACGRATFVCRDRAPRLLDRVTRRDFELIRLDPDTTTSDDASKLAEIASERDAAWIVIDGYSFDSRYHRAVAASGRSMCVLDDGQRWSHPGVDMIINQNLGGEHVGYTLARHAQLLAGADYALLRPSFMQLPLTRDAAQRVRRVLVVMGGADPSRATELVLESLGQVELAGAEVDVVVGPANPRRDELEKLASHIASCRLVVDPPDISELMRAADLAIVAAGSTLWEIAALGLPSIAIVVSDNQEPLAAAMADADAVQYGGRQDCLDPSTLAVIIERVLGDAEHRAKLARRGRELIDGHGAMRVVARMREQAILLRPVAHDDAKLIWHWANDPVIRASSFSTQQIAWDEHEAWFSAALANPRLTYWIATDIAGRPWGQCRIEERDGRGVISFSVEPARRDHGWGSRLASLAARRWLHQTGANIVVAYVKPENTASCRALEHANFRAADDANIRGAEARSFVLVPFMPS